ncbi:helix-turn-helix transcriptional regulator [Sphingomonas colocasiae]|uniref:AraC family transcriptional regulator n=1 Tax=Sphingomonas colocasiae TaxID=1848973 RepID=A0ABS7PZ36_9SPHN|nr:AraC family transcriptional regulator [Sphingomonas colocasiae]MBY8826204.1 AraC family transcriptional regulator [Sphingomonas colocasiae]
MTNPNFPPRTPATRSIQDMKRMFRSAHDTGVRTPGADDGWFKPLGEAGFRYDYDINVARGGWEFHELGNGLSLIVTDMVAVMPTPRSHRMTDHLVMSIVVDGVIPFADPGGTTPADPMTRGFCTVYGLREGGAVETFYEPGKHLRWISIVIDCEHFRDATGIDPRALPQDMRAFLDGDELRARHVPVTHPAVSLAAVHLLECPYDGMFRTAYMRAKASELICHVLAAMTDAAHVHLGERLSAADLRRLEKAMQILRANPQAPVRVDDLAGMVGMSRRRLQHGFRQLYGETVCNVRDRLRMDLALDLVIDSDMPMIEIALETGYEHPASFTRAFKSTFAASPIAARNAARAGRFARRRQEAARTRPAP